MFAKYIDTDRVEYPPKTYRSETDVIFNFNASETAMRRYGYCEMEYTNPTAIDDIPEGYTSTVSYALREPV